jgi:hypothetical protein
MQRICLVLLAAVLPVSAQWRHFGQSDLQPTASLGLGLSAPVNPLATRLDTGWSLAGGAGIQRGSVGIMVDFLAAGLGVNHATLVRQGAQHGTQKYWALTLDPIVHINQRGPADFYLTGGAGVYGQLTKYRIPAGTASQYDLIHTENLYRPGVNGGAGFAFNLGEQRVKLFLEARYHHMFTPQPGASLIPVTVGVRF